ncbi:MULTISPECIES: Fe-S cluster assembly sulfur transfer protein SufU [unclassified Granulicatella]|uniref:Fe-S cluster assembly sulfur transfer protein SufU n=1 Tax=unclassified Granulicatella TaxID=2630493 RepID=UPI001073383F|nr:MULTISPECIES: SUF system NifU family Fe-S cluster assembly protein [unclassified Granulicatella]MBF0779577.1 SUF system NifU family Fe-S cluster assembly protein [Granulicatella sp. 19428wC4_WM01]TFU96379.1 SUF system NifU family Fe-S cluster assembly protein [Granulicatella sp. WM01]
MSALSKLDQLYRQVILDHSQNPRRYNKVIPVTDYIELKNPTCGDVITVQLAIKDNCIVDATFFGEGCSISRASASMLMENIIGDTLQQAKCKAINFFELVQGHHSDVDLKDAELLEGVSKFPARIRCATLAWKALEHIIDKKIEE